jgi:hypothetical protein
MQRSLKQKHPSDLIKPGDTLPNPMLEIPYNVDILRLFKQIKKGIPSKSVKHLRELPEQAARNLNDKYIFIFII